MLCFADDGGIFDVRGVFEAAGSCGHLPVPGDQSSTAGSASRLRRHLGLRQKDVEVREDARVL